MFHMILYFSTFQVTDEEVDEVQEPEKVGGWLTFHRGEATFSGRSPDDFWGWNHLASSIFLYMFVIDVAIVRYSSFGFIPSGNDCYI